MSAEYPNLDLALYEADGVLVAARFFPSAVIDQLEQGTQALRDHIAGAGMVRRSRFIWGCLPDLLASIAYDERLVRAAQTILATGDIALYMQRMLLKDEDWSGAVALHQDMPYFSGGLRKLSVFVPLKPTSAKNGAGGIIFVKKSHLYGNLGRGTIRREVFPAMEDLAPNLSTGDVVFMDFLTWHYSEQAAVPQDRPVLQIVYQSAADGSYAGGTLGVLQPTLISGEWQTAHFAARDECTIPDG